MRKARLDPGRRDVCFEPDNDVLLNTSHTPLPSRCPLSSRWMGPFQVLRQTAPNIYQLACRPRGRRSPSSTSPDCGATTAGPPGRAVRRWCLNPSWSPQTSRPSTRCRRSSASGCAGGTRSALCVGSAKTRPATRGSQWSTSPTASRRFATSRRRRAFMCRDVTGRTGPVKPSGVINYRF